MILETLIPALLPAAADGVRGLFNRLTGGAGAKPANVSEVVTLMEADTNRLKVVAEIDKAGNISQWVANIRALQRPVAIVGIIAGYLVAVMTNADPDVTLDLSQYAQMVTFYLFGDRTYSYFKKGS